MRIHQSEYIQLAHSSPVWYSDWRELTPEGMTKIQGSHNGFAFSVQYRFDNAVGTGGTVELEFTNHYPSGEYDTFAIPASTLPTPFGAPVITIPLGTSHNEFHLPLYTAFRYYRVKYTRGSMTGGTMRIYATR